MTEKQIKRFYKLGLILGMFIPTVFILSISLGQWDMNLYYAIIYLGLIPALISFIGSIVWMVLFLIRWLADKKIHIKNFKIPFVLNLLILIFMGLISLFRFVFTYTML